MVQEDRISSLPDSILIHILSFLQMKDAVKTVLHRRFGGLWASIQNLDFDARSYNNYSIGRENKWFTNFVNRVLLMHECPTIFRFSLKFGSFLYFAPSDIKPPRHPKPLRREFASNIDSWIHFAVRKKVKVLELGILANVSSSSRFDYDLPGIVLTSDSLTELKLVNIGLRQEGLIRMRLLKVLSLTTIMLNDTVIEEILSGCPLLESLSIIKCYGLHKLICTSTSLKKLLVVLGEYELSRMEISGPNILSLHISGSRGRVDLKNLSSLIEATLGLCFGGSVSNDDYCNVWMLFEKLHHAKMGWTVAGQKAQFGAMKGGQRLNPRGSVRKMNNKVQSRAHNRFLALGKVGPEKGGDPPIVAQRGDKAHFLKNGPSGAAVSSDASPRMADEDKRHKKTLTSIDPTRNEVLMQR
ncbi:hypothetical protein F0562_008367 [Nyssa sinensis]|uniref:At1g61320/AtMIF1 LRR domain-containing protein n=1 Tax=Nyssa sinensis TaxID=561372 RepID=A0A5J5A7I0_9ASTE|nr:hypothetical protein F0562_008367 [Nyssa sinensis]